MRDYVHWATLGALCEFLPQPDNRVTLADENDRHGLPVAHFSYSQCDNDRQLIRAAHRRRWRTSCAPPAPSEVITIERYAHLVGGARMAAAPAGRRGGRRPPGLRRRRTCYVVDGSALPTQGSANPALTIMALAARAADRDGRGHAAGSGDRREAVRQ